MNKNKLRGLAFTTCLAISFNVFADCEATDFQCVTNAAPGSTVTSVSKVVPAGTLGGISGTRISTNRGQYRINSESFRSSDSFIRRNDRLQMRLNASSTPGAEVVQVVSINGNPDQVFRVITATQNTGPSNPPPPPPAEHFVRWDRYGSLTVPADNNADGGADTIQPAQLAGYRSRFFYPTSAGQRTEAGYVAAQGESVFYTPVDCGATTANSEHCRSEMRQQIVLGNSNVNFPLTGTHIQTGTLRVTQLPTPKVANARVLTIVGQIHAKDSLAPPVKLVYALQNGRGTVFVSYNPDPEPGAGVSSTIRPEIPLGQSFNYELSLINGIAAVKVNGAEIYRVDMRQGWEGYNFYFKAGNYVGHTPDDATGAAEVVYSNASVVHN